MYQPKTTEDYLELVDQAIFEVQDLVRCAEEEDDGIVEFAAQLPVYRELAEALAEAGAILEALNVGTAWEIAVSIRGAQVWRQAGSAVYAPGAPVAFAHPVPRVIGRPEHRTQGGVLNCTRQRT